MPALATAIEPDEDMLSSHGDEVSYYEAHCAHCKVVHPCKNVAGVIHFAPDWSIDCPMRGMPAPEFKWTGAD